MKVDMKKEKGFTLVDVSLALIIIVLFASTVASIMYSLYISTTEAKRTAVAVNYAVDIFERIGSMAYSSVSGTEVLAGIDNVREIATKDDGTVGAKIRNI